MEQAAREVKLQIQKSGQGDITFFRFVGTIDENFDGASLAKGLTGHLVISLDKVRRITSFGIRQWVDFVMRVTSTCSAVYFVECAPRIIDQFNMVANFGGRGFIVSFFAPFRCDQCGAERLKLVQVDRDKEMIRSLNLEGDACPNDGNQEYFDDDPDTYLSYIAAQPDFEMEPHVAAFLVSRTTYDVTDGMRKVRIEKKIQDRYTFISISGDIGDDFPLQKISEGLEGDVVFDLAGVGQITDQGRELWRKLLSMIAPSTERILIVGLAAAMLDGLSRNHDLAEKGQALTIHLPYTCNSCQITTQLEIDVSRNHEVMRFATPPELTCPDCGREVNCVATEGMLSGLTELPVPATDLNPDQIIAWSRKAPEGPVPVAGGVPSLPTARPAVGAPTRGWPALVALALVGVVGAGVAIYLAVHKGSGDQMSEKAELVEASHPKPPAWRDQAFSVRGDQILVAGRSGYVEDKEEGFKVAKSAALEELAHQVATSIRDPLWVEHVGSQFQGFRAKAVGDLEQALVSGDQESITKSRTRVRTGQGLVAKALMEGVAATVQPERSHFYWEKLTTPQGIRYRVWSLFRVGKGEFKRLVEHFSRREEALSATAVALFPGMAWRYNELGGAVILGLKADSPMKFIGVLPGDILVSAQDRVIKDGTSFRRVLTQEYTDLQRTGGTMVLQIKRGDAPVVKHRLKVAKKAPTVKRPVSGSGRRPPAGGGRRPPPANIWDDNPFE